MAWAIYCETTGELKSLVQGKRPTSLPDGERSIETDKAASELLNCIVENGEIVAKDSAQIEFRESERAWFDLRAYRASLLRAHVDTMNPARWEAMTEAQRQAWRAYRQALLDLPETTTDPRHPDWPARPG